MEVSSKLHAHRKSTNRYVTLLGLGTGIVAVDKSSAASTNRSLIPHAFSLQFFTYIHVCVLEVVWHNTDRLNVHSATAKSASKLPGHYYTS